MSNQFAGQVNNLLTLRGPMSPGPPSMAGSCPNDPKSSPKVPRRRPNKVQRTSQSRQTGIQKLTFPTCENLVRRQHPQEPKMSPKGANTWGQNLVHRMWEISCWPNGGPNPGAAKARKPQEARADRPDPGTTKARKPMEARTVGKPWYTKARKPALVTTARP